MIIALDGDLSAAVSAEGQEALERILSALRAETGDDVEVDYGRGQLARGSKHRGRLLVPCCPDGTPRLHASLRQWDAASV
jgi:hypothetical protein